MLNVFYLYILLFLNSFVFNSDILTILLFFVSIISLLLFKREYRLFYLFNLSFISSVFKVSFFPTSLVTILILAFSIIEFIYFISGFFGKVDFSPRNLILPLLLLLLLVAHVSLMWLLIKDGRPSFNRIISFGNTLAFIYSLTLFIRRLELLNEPDFSKKFLINHVINFTIFGVLSLPVFYPYFGEKFFAFTNFGIYSRYVMTIPGASFSLVRFSTVFQDPNISSAFSAMTLSLTLIYQKIFVEYLGKKITLMVIFIVTIISVLSFSKMGILTIFLVYIIRLVIYIIDVKKEKKQINPLIFYLPATVIAIVIVFMNEFVMKFISRFSEGYMINFETTINALTSNRFFITKDIVGKFLDKFEIILFGTGIENNYILSTFDNISHDTFIQTITSLGILFTFVLVFYLYTIKNALRINNFNLKTRPDRKCLLMVIPVLNLFFLALLTYSALYLMFILVAILYNEVSLSRKITYE